MSDYLSKWTIPRLIQLAIGLFFLHDYYVAGGQLPLIFGGVMFAQAAFNVGCFSSKGCSTPASNQQLDDTPVSDEVEVEYEEVDM
jgi:hypothetical protein